jgi:hypothetical protein
MAFVQPNLWTLSGGGILWRYSTTLAIIHYQDSFRNLTFNGPQIRTVNVPDVGTMVSVTIFLTVDTGSTTFTVILPVVNLNPVGMSSAPVSTWGLTTHHHFSINPAFDHGQQEFTSVTALTGTGTHL